MLKMLRLMHGVMNVRQIKLLLGAYALSAVAQGVTLALLWGFLRALLAKGVGGMDAADQRLAGWLVAVCMSGWLTFGLYLVITNWSYRVSVYAICDELMQRLAAAVVRLPVGWFTPGHRAAVINATSRDVNTLSHLASLVFPAIITGVVSPLVMAMTIAIIDWRLGLVLLFAGVLLGLIWGWMRRSVQGAQAVEARLAQQVSGRLVEFAKLQQVLRASGKTTWAPLESELAAESAGVLRALRAGSRPAAAFLLVVELAFAAILGWGGMLVVGAHLDFASFLAIAVVMTRLNLPLAQSVLYSQAITDSMQALERVRGIILAAHEPATRKHDKVSGGDDATTETNESDEDSRSAAGKVKQSGETGESGELGQPSETSTTSTEMAAPKGGAIKFSEVTFGYDPKHPVLRDISFTAPAGKVTALVGRSGVGKTTALGLVADFWQPQAGSITIGGRDVRSIDPMREVAMVFQDVYLFSGTIRENLSLAKPGASEAEIAQAAASAGLDSVLANLPQGLDTPVGPSGNALSGGERQRVAIARALLKDSPVLLVDEITSALDSVTEATLGQAIRELAAGRTVLMVAHRPATIAWADQVIDLGKK